MVMGDLAARHWYAALVYLLNETASPEEVADGYPLRAELAELTGRTSVPALYVGGEFLGGCNDGGLGGVMTLDRDGKLKSLLADAGALA